MRDIVIIATCIGARPDGISTYALQLLQALAPLGAGHRLRVLVNEAARARLSEVSLPEGAVVEWVSARAAPEHGTRGHLYRRLHAEWTGWRYRKSLVVALSPLEAPLLGGAGVVTVHDLTPLELPGHHPRQRYFYEHLLPPVLRRAARIVVPSAATRDAVVRRFAVDPWRIRVIPHGSPVPLRPLPLRPLPLPTSPSAFVLCIGRADPVKNQETLLRAFLKLGTRVDCGLVVAGVGVHPGTWDDLPLGALTGRLRLLPDVSETDKLRLIDEAALLVDASLDEGFGFPALEAMSRGCPVAAARAGALAEVCGDAALYFDPRDVDGLATLLDRVLADAPARAALSARGRRRAEAFSWRRAAEEHLSVFEEALLERRTP